MGSSGLAVDETYSRALTSSRQKNTRILGKALKQGIARSEEPGLFEGAYRGALRKLRPEESDAESSPDGPDEADMAKEGRDFRLLDRDAPACQSFGRFKIERRNRPESLVYTDPFHSFLESRTC